MENKQNTMKKIFLLLLLPLLAATFNSCSMEKGAKSGGDENTKLIKTLVSCYQVNYGDFFELWTNSYEFIYDSQQRIKIIKSSHDGDGIMRTIITTFSYENNRIIKQVSGSVSYDGSAESETIYTLDGKGYVTKIDERLGVKNYSSSIEYSNGYIYDFSGDTGDTFWGEGFDNYEHNSKHQTFTWENGNLTKTECRNLWEGDALTTVATYEYSNKANKTNINFPYLLSLGYGTEWEQRKGWTSQNLPTKEVYHEYFEGDSGYDYMFAALNSYTYDSDGYPIEIIQKIYWEDVYGWDFLEFDDMCDIDTITITYY